MGMQRRCVSYKRVHTKRGTELRCAKSVKSGKTQSSRQPSCPVGLKRSGASPGLMRGSLRYPSTCGRGRKHRRSSR